jgi:hypothetical protein
VAIHGVSFAEKAVFAGNGMMQRRQESLSLGVFAWNFLFREWC